MSWSFDPTDYGKKIKKDHADLLRKTAGKIYQGVVTKSPVDTGRFRSNWQTINAGADEIYILNNLPYAMRLEHGWSKQAPQGMVSITLKEVQKWLDSQK